MAKRILPARHGLFTASEAEAQTGVLATTLRQWERRYGFPNPTRSAGGYRLYSGDDLRAIGLMQAHLQRGLPAARAAELTLQGVPPDESERRETRDPTLATQLVDALLSGDDDEAHRVLAEAHAKLNVETVLVNVISPAMVEIGQRWARSEITVAHEHRASAFVRDRLSALLDVAGRQQGYGPLVVAACAPGEEHELGLMMLSLALRRRGVRVQYLGANTPVMDLAVFAREQRAQAVLLALSGEWSLEHVQTQVPALQTMGVPVFMGGPLLNADPALAARLGGVYAGPDAPRAADQIAAYLHGINEERT